MNEEYLQELYNYLGQNDESFSAEIDFATFSSDMQDQQYAAQIYNYLGGLDDTFKMEVNVNQFFEDIGAVKKKTNQNKVGIYLRKMVHRNLSRLKRLISTPSELQTQMKL